MLNQFELSEEIAIVSGALGKLGPLWIEALLCAGARVVGIDLEQFSHSHTINNLIAQHGSKKLFFYQADICNQLDVIKMRDYCLKEVGIPTVLVNNAGLDQPPAPIPTSDLEVSSLEGFRNIFEVNVVGSYLMTQIIGEEMIKNGRGSVINIGSLYASVSPDKRFYEHIECNPPFLKPPAYGASKAALLNLTKYFATHWAQHGIRVNALSPGGVLGDQDETFKRKFTARIPLGRMARNEDLIGPLIFLASKASSYITGENLKVDGGFTAW